VIGNDVVDLVDEESRAEALHERFDQRVFVASERARLEDLSPRHPLRWIFWAAKESAFKVVRQRLPSVAFAPIRFVVALGPDWTGRVYYNGCRYPVRVTVHDDHVHAIATEPGRDFDGVFSGVHQLARSASLPPRIDDGSREARAFAVRQIAEHIGVPPDTLAIERSDRVPRIVHRSGRETLDLSLSHHGRFVAYACAERLPPVHAAW